MILTYYKELYWSKRIMKLSDYIVKMFLDLGIDIVFGYIGGNIADIIDSICESSSIRFIQSYNEQASAFAANAYAQLSGRTSVVISSSGPGALNLINGIANAYFDSIPCVFITGNVHSLGRRNSNKIRQNAFQETDIVEIVKSITKYSVYISDADEIKYQLEKGFYIAGSGRKGPVLIDIPYDIQRKQINVNELKGYKKQNKCKKDFDIESVRMALINSHRPLLLVGGGCQDSKNILREMLKTVKIPVVVSMRGLDVISHQDISYIGLIGMYGNRLANLAVLNCDLLIVLGSRLDERQMGYDRTAFAPCAHIIQIDIDKNELGRKTDNFISICSDVGDFLRMLSQKLPAYACDMWFEFLNEWKKNENLEYKDRKEVCANKILEQISEMFNENAVIVSDVGQNQIVCAQSLLLKSTNAFLCSSGLACMGYSLPASIGAQYVSLNRQIISINGDGGIMMNLQELQTIKREKLPIKIIILNNKCLGLIRKLQEKLFNQRYYASIEGYLAADFSKIATAFDFDYLKIDTNFNSGQVSKLLGNKNPVIIEIQLPYMISTMLEPGENIYTQYPLLADDGIENFRKQLEKI